MKEQIFKYWSDSLAIQTRNGAFLQLEPGPSGMAQYKGILLETYHQAGINPQIQAFATMFFKDNPRNIITMFYKHAISEIGHDLLAQNDLLALGESESFVKNSRPLPTTLALNAYVIYQIQFLSPLAYLGYLFHLEFFPTTTGGGIMDMLARANVPAAAMSFLKEHSTVDVGHNKLMEKYLQYFIQTEDQMRIVAQTAADTCVLHMLMIEKAMENGKKIFLK